MRMMTSWQAFCLWTVFWSIFMIVGAVLAWQQIERLRHSQPVPAEIVTRAVSTDYDDAGAVRTYAQAHYRYEFEGRSYRSHNIYPMEVSFEGGAGIEVARTIASQYGIGKRVTAYIDPDDPHLSFLKLHFAPYVFLLVATTMLSAGMTASVRDRTKTEQQPISIATLASVILWIGLGFAITGHFFWNSPRPYGQLPLISLLCYEAVGLMVLTQLAVPDGQQGWCGAMRGGVGLGTIGLYLGLILAVLLLQVASLLRLLGLTWNAGQYIAHVMLFTGGSLGLLGVIGGAWPSRRSKRGT